MNFNDYLTLLAKNGGSDLFLSTGAPPCAKFHGKLKPLDKDPFTPGEIRDIAYEIMDGEQQKEFDQELEMNLAYAIPKVGRFRVNIFKQRNEISIVARNIVTDIPNVDSLGLPSVLKDVIMTKRGLVLFVGATGSGKSTSLAALIDHRNTNSSGHIITIEDPIEFIHRHKRSIVNQREIGVDTRSFHQALKNTLRQAPDVILIGEIRDRETMEHAIAFAETGHLCISTLHANNANQALDRIINFFPEERRNQLLLDLSLNLKCFVSQRLIPTLDGKRCAAIEILLGTPTVAQAIHKGEVESIKEIMAKSENLGMQTFDAALFKLYEEGKISFEDALKNADSSNNLRLRIKLESTRGIPAGEEEPDTSSSNRRPDNAFSLQIEEEPPEPES
ncbi:MAG: PilT/PilU family type 4a pilus ATPase [Spongiibacter marinus]|uniref:PilT/PilU family type 4a pilus ATPase n=2 Tax=Spongiibacter marinus TaxID=354246 RepID=UPI003C5B023C